MSPAGSGLEVSGLTVRYGSLTAVNDATFTAPIGRLTGLIGPNGAGKTTTFNACSGLTPLSDGKILFNGSDISRLGPAARARKGIGRTFQRMELYLSMTVAENVALGREAALGAANPLRQFMSNRRQRQTIAAVTEEAIEICGLAALASKPVSVLSTGQRRLVELARACAGDYQLLLLDEPSSGLDPSETGRFGAILQQLVAERGLGILLVEHDMSLVMRVCEYLYVLDFGQLIFEGTTAETHASPIVRAAYLGTEAAAPADTRAASAGGRAHAGH